MLGEGLRNHGTWNFGTLKLWNLEPGTRNPEPGTRNPNAAQQFSLNLSYHRK